ncbi:MAG: hypothetical protein AAFR66_23075, partial [Bacteroidota bacterium]
MSKSGNRSLEFEKIPFDDSLQRGKNYLLAIGIDSYKDESIPNLHNAVKDTRAIVSLLQEEYEFYPNQITALYDQEADHDNILHALDDLAGQVQEEDSLVLYLAGHGHYRKERKLGYLIPADGTLKRLSTLILHSTIKSYLQPIQARHILIIADTCFSGGLMTTRSLEEDSSELAERVEAFPSRILLAAGRIEEVEDGIRGDHSPFAKSVLTYLDEKRGERFPVSDLAQHVKRTVPRNARQTPISGRMFRMGDQDGEFVFYRKQDEEADWRGAHQIHTISSYENYLSKYGEKALYSQEAKAQLILLQEESAWESAERKNSAASYYQYVRQYPDGKHVSLARSKMLELEEEEEWKKALSRHSLSAFDGYLQKYPNGKYVAKAQEEIDHLISGKKKAPVPSPTPKKTTPSVGKPTAHFEKIPAKQTTTPQQKSTPEGPSWLAANGQYLLIGGLLMILLVIVMNWRPNKTIPTAEKATQAEAAPEKNAYYQDLVIYKYNAPNGYIFQDEAGKYYGFVDKNYNLVTPARYDMVES